MKLKHAAISTFFGLSCYFVLFSTAMAGNITICNSDNQDIEYAMLWDEGIPVIADTWLLEGWFLLKPGACKLVLKSSYRQTLYMSVRNKTRAGTRIMHLDARTLGKKESVRGGMYRVEDFYCVSKNTFKRSFKDINDHMNCPLGYYYQLFNLLVFSPSNTNTTANIGGSSQN